MIAVFNASRPAFNPAIVKSAFEGTVTGVPCDGANPLNVVFIRSNRLPRLRSNG